MSSSAKCPPGSGTWIAQSLILTVWYIYGGGLLACSLACLKPLPHRRNTGSLLGRNRERKRGPVYTLTYHLETVWTANQPTNRSRGGRGRALLPVHGPWEMSGSRTWWRKLKIKRNPNNLNERLLAWRPRQFISMQNFVEVLAIHTTNTRRVHPGQEIDQRLLVSSDIFLGTCSGGPAVPGRSLEIWRPTRRQQQRAQSILYANLISDSSLLGRFSGKGTFSKCCLKYMMKYS